MFLIYHAASQPTGSKIAEALRIPHGLSTDDMPNAWRGTDVLIRWGSRSPWAGTGKAARTLNIAKALELASDKMKALAVMREAGVRVPDFDTDPEALVSRVGWPIMGRKKTHARGTDIVLCMQRRDLRRERHHYTQYIPTKREYRIHVVGDDVIRVQGKYLDVAEDAVPWIRNYEHGYRFRAPSKRLHKERTDMAVQAVRALGLDFGAVDVIVGDDGLTYVLEVNTAPSCSPLTAAGYVSKLAAMAGIENYDLSALDLLNPDAEEQDSEEEA